MAKKKNRKKYNKKKSRSMINLNTFINRICYKCGLCGELGDAEFCYDVMYKENPSIFVEHCVKKLSALKDWKTNVEDGVSTDDLRSFIDLFCTSNICTNKSAGIDCDYIYECMLAFSQQIENSYDLDDLDFYTGMEIIDLSNKKAKKKKTKVKQPTPLFFCNDKAVWDVIIQRTINGNHIDKQNKIEGGAGSTT